MDRSVTAAMRGVSHVVHLASRVHVMNETAEDPVRAYREANVDATLAVAQAAAAAGATRFVFVSSVKVYGDSGRFAEADQPTPADPYGRSKLDAENGLRALSAETGLDVVVVRPPLVYGPGVRANFAALMRLISSGVPLPFAAIDNRRSYVAIDNLSDAIRAILQYPAALNETFTITDGHDLSTPELIRRMGRAMQRRVRLFPFSPSAISALASLCGQGAAAQRLLGSLYFETHRARDILDWRPPVDLDEGLRRVTAAMTL